MWEVHFIEVLVLVVAGIDEGFFACFFVNVFAHTLGADAFHHALHG